jgi:hypothetical protein
VARAIVNLIALEVLATDLPVFLYRNALTMLGAKRRTLPGLQLLAALHTGTGILVFLHVTKAVVRVEVVRRQSCPAHPSRFLVNMSATPNILARLRPRNPMADTTPTEGFSKVFLQLRTVSTRNVVYANEHVAMVERGEGGYSRAFFLPRKNHSQVPRLLAAQGTLGVIRAEQERSGLLGKFRTAYFAPFFTHGLSPSL